MSDLQYHGLVCMIFALGISIFHRPLSNYAYSETERYRLSWFRPSQSTWNWITTAVATVWAVAAISFWALALAG